MESRPEEPTREILLNEGTLTKEITLEKLLEVSSPPQEPITDPQQPNLDDKPSVPSL